MSKFHRFLYHDIYSGRYMTCLCRDEVYPKDVIFMKSFSHISNTKATLVLEFPNIYAPQRVEIFGGSDHQIRKFEEKTSRPSPSYQHSIFNHMKTILLSPQQIINPKKSQQMKVILELEEHDLQPFYRLLVFPSMNKINLHRVCELSSVYILYESSPLIAVPTSPRPTPSPIGAEINSMMFPTPPKTSKKSYKSIFRRNQQIHIGLHPLTSSVITAISPSNSHGGEDDDDQETLTPKDIEHLLSKWLKRFEDKQKIKSNLNLIEFHFHEIEWMSKSIAMIQQICDDSSVAVNTDSRESQKLKRTQRETPYMFPSIQRMRKRLLQASSLFPFLLDHLHSY